jgi:hypothetical protein
MDRLACSTMSSSLFDTFDLRHAVLVARRYRADWPRYNKTVSNVFDAGIL